MSSADATVGESRCELTIRFPQVDPAGIVFYPRYFEMVQRCFPGVPLSETPAGVKTQFLQPNRFGDRIELVCEPAGDVGDWSIAGRMEGATCFTMVAQAAGDATASRDASQHATFVAEEFVVGSWCVDQHGHLYLSRYFEFLNMAIEEWFEAVLGVPFAELHVGRRIGIPTVQFDTQVHALPNLGDTVSIRIQPRNLGGSAMTFTSWLVDKDHCFIESEQVVVFVQMSVESFESIEIPDYIRAAFTKNLDMAH